jgi:hypothetical protein
LEECSRNRLEQAGTGDQLSINMRSAECWTNLVLVSETHVILASEFVKRRREVGEKVGEGSEEAEEIRLRF